MGSISRAYALAEIGEFEDAAEALRLEVVESGSTVGWVALCEWIAVCLERARDFEEAGGWYETAAELALLELWTTPLASPTDALNFFELASSCYRAGGRRDSTSRTSILGRALITMCPPA